MNKMIAEYLDYYSEHIKDGLVTSWEIEKKAIRMYRVKQNWN